MAAACGAAGGLATAVSSAIKIQAAAASQSELARNNLEIEAQLKEGYWNYGGNGIVTDKIQTDPTLRRYSPYLKKIGLDNDDCLQILNGQCVHNNGKT